MTALYKPLPVFFGFAAVLTLGGVLLVSRYVYFWQPAMCPEVTFNRSFSRPSSSSPR